MEKPRVIRFKDLGIVSVAMDPKNPTTNFDLALEKAVPAGKIYQLAMINKDNTKFRLLDDIIKHKKVIYNIDSFTYLYLRLTGETIDQTFSKGINREEMFLSTLNGHFCVGTKRVDCGSLEKSLVLKNLDTKPENYTTLDIKFLKKNNDRFVNNQIKMFNKQLKKENEILSPEF